MTAKAAHKTIAHLRRVLEDIAYGSRHMARITAREELDRLERKLKKIKK